VKIEQVKTVGVVGAGLMGNGIAFSFALGGYDVLMHDLSDEILEGAVANMKATAALYVEEGLLESTDVAQILSRVVSTTHLDRVAEECDFVTEAIVERFEDKKILFDQLDVMCPPRTILASNTSGLVVSEFGADVARKDKLIVTHYFAPPAIVPGVEVVRCPTTSEETFDLTWELMKRTNRVPIRVDIELPGHLLNRLQGAMSREAFRLWAQGVASAEDIDLGVRSTFGLRMPYQGPIRHLDLGGQWGWPEDVRERMVSRMEQAPRETELNSEAIARLRRGFLEGKPWLCQDDEVDEIRNARDRELLRRVKEIYRH
jgi:3-hydroxybutyryl-CoA dehydrogenase